MKLIQDHNCVLRKRLTGEQPVCQHALRQKPEARSGVPDSFEANLIADSVSGTLAQFLRHASGSKPCRQPSRLQNIHMTSSCLEQSWWNSRGLPCSRFGLQESNRV